MSEEGEIKLLKKFRHGNKERNMNIFAFILHVFLDLSLLKKKGRKKKNKRTGERNKK